MVTEIQKKSSNEGVWNGDGDTEKVWAGCVVQESKKNTCIVFSINNILMQHIVHLIHYIVILLLLYSSF